LHRAILQERDNPEYPSNENFAEFGCNLLIFKKIKNDFFAHKKMMINE
jgi:hypothetical protein